MDINERIKRIKKYFVMVNITDEGSYVMVKFNPKWVIPKKGNKAVEVVKKNDGYYFCAMPNVDISKVFDYIELTIGYNKEIEERAELFKQKVGELKHLFETDTIENLRNITFVTHCEIVEDEETLYPTDVNDTIEIEQDTVDDDSTDNENETEEVGNEEETVDEGVSTTGMNSETANAIMNMAKELNKK